MIDNTAPSIASTTGPAIDTHFALDGQLDFSVVWNEDVTVSTPAASDKALIVLTLPDASTIDAGHQSTDGATSTFRYTVVATDNATALTPANAVSLVGDATIKDAAGNSALLSLSGHEFVLTGIALDTTKPQVGHVVAAGTGWTWSCNDANPCTYRYQVSEDANAPADWPLGASEYQETAVFTFSPVPKTADYYIHIQAKDGAGNLSTLTSSTSELSLTRTAPLAVIDLQMEPGLEWTWGCNDETCEFRHIVNRNISHTFSPTTTYNSHTTAKLLGVGAYRIFVQARGHGEESLVVDSYANVRQYRLSSFGIGARHSCIVNHLGNLRCWGAPSDGAVFGALTTESAFARTAQSDGTTEISDAVQVVAGAGHTCYLAPLSAGGVGAYCMGSRSSGSIGDGATSGSTTAPTVVSVDGQPVNDLVQLSSQESHVCALRTNGQILCWGNGAEGALGDGTNQSNQSTPVSVKVADTTSEKALQGIIQVSAGFGHTCALHNSGEVSCWGKGGSGQIGIDTNHANRPQKILMSSGGSPLEHIVQVDTGQKYSCALQVAPSSSSGGQIYCWGGEIQWPLGR